MPQKKLPFKPEHDQILNILVAQQAPYWTGPTLIGEAMGKPKSSASAYTAPLLKFLLNRRIIKRNVKGQYRLSRKGHQMIGVQSNAEKAI